MAWLNQISKDGIDILARSTFKLLTDSHATLQPIQKAEVKQPGTTWLSTHEPVSMAKLPD